ncbi:hypothetical protein U1Q18_022641, partial [Sarracenia purpurea var. burkii]
SDEDETIQAADFENLILCDANSAGDPRDGRKHSIESEGFVEGRDVVPQREAASVVNAGVGRLFLEDGEERENDEGQSYVNGRRSE